MADAGAGRLQGAMAGRGAGPVGRLFVRPPARPGARRPGLGHYLGPAAAGRGGISAIVQVRTGAGRVRVQSAGWQQIHHARPVGRSDAHHVPGGQAAPGRLHRLPGPGRRGTRRHPQGGAHPHHCATGGQQPRRGRAAELGVDRIHESGLATAVPPGPARGMAHAVRHGAK
ncbi:hypothetical protein G6F31_019266 [Rhizopus arrhizus]|nr:hypothetical protein G6F31_019266 [Rhizopus arrhizus]